MLIHSDDLKLFINEIKITIPKGIKCEPKHVNLPCMHVSLPPLGMWATC
jgi:hypothetical protein